MSSQANIASMVAYYARLLPYQFQKPRAQAMVSCFVNQLIANGLPEVVQNAFNVRTATGEQLDVIGKYVGLPRTIGEATPLPYFGFVDYAGGGNENGFANYDGTTNPLGIFFQYQYQGQKNTALSDDSYSFMINLKIVLNSSDGTLFGIQKLLKELLPGYVTVIDNRDMTLTYSISTNAPVSPAVITPYLPKPMGVDIDVTTFSTLGTSGGDTVVTSDGDTILIPGSAL